MGCLYWGRIFRSGERSLWTVKANLTWRMTDTCMKSRFSGGMDALEEWNNRTRLARVEVSISIQYAGGFRLRHIQRHFLEDPWCQTCPPCRMRGV